MSKPTQNKLLKALEEHWWPVIHGEKGIEKEDNEDYQAIRRLIKQGFKREKPKLTRGFYYDETHR